MLTTVLLSAFVLGSVGIVIPILYEVTKRLQHQSNSTNHLSGVHTVDPPRLVAPATEKILRLALAKSEEDQYLAARERQVVKK